MNIHRPLPDVSQTVQCHTTDKQMDLSPDQLQAQHTYHAAFYAFQADPDDLDPRKADFVAIRKASFTAAGDSTLYDEYIAPASLDQPITFRGQTMPKWWWWLTTQFVPNLRCSPGLTASELQDLYQKLHNFTDLDLKHLSNVVYDCFREVDGAIEECTGHTTASAHDEAIADHDSLPCAIVFHEQDGLNLGQLAHANWLAKGGPLTLTSLEPPKSTVVDSFDFDNPTAKGSKVKFDQEHDQAVCSRTLYIDAADSMETYQYCRYFDASDCSPKDLVEINYKLAVDREAVLHIVWTIWNVGSDQRWTENVPLGLVLIKHPSLLEVISRQVPRFQPLLDRLDRKPLDTHIIRSPGIVPGGSYRPGMLRIDSLGMMWIGLWKDGLPHWMSIGGVVGEEQGIWMAFIDEGRPLDSGGLLQVRRGDKLSDCLQFEETVALAGYFLMKKRVDTQSPLPVSSLSLPWLAMCALAEARSATLGGGSINPGLLSPVESQRRFATTLWYQLMNIPPEDYRPTGLRVSDLIEDLPDHLPNMFLGSEGSGSLAPPFHQFTDWVIAGPPHANLREVIQGNLNSWHVSRGGMGQQDVE